MRSAAPSPQRIVPAHNHLLTTAEKRMLYLHNQTRGKYRLSQFCVHPALQNAARAHSEEMIDRGYFSHDSFTGETFSAQALRLQRRYAGENIPGRFGSYGTASTG